MGDISYQGSGPLLSLKGNENAFAYPLKNLDFLPSEVFFSKPFK